jgi:hypothetical protein
MNQKRPAIKMSHANSTEPGALDRDTPIPSSGRRGPMLDRDETSGLVSVLFYAQQSAAEATAFIAEAQDANDAELTRFLEDSQRESLARVEEAKRLLLARLQMEVDDASQRAIHEAPHGRVHYVSVPDSDPSPLNTPY